MSSREFPTESIDLAAYLAAAGHTPSTYRAEGGARAVFVFAETDSLHQDIVMYERGGVLPAKRLLNVRSWLFREASAVVKGGRS